MRASPTKPGFSSLKLRRFDEALDLFLFRFSAYALPLLMALFTGVALLTWNTSYPTDHARSLAFRVLHQEQADATPATVWPALENQPYVREFDTKLAETPVWISFQLPATMPTPAAVELPSRHGTELTCWNSATLQFLGSGDRQRQQGHVSRVKAGFAIALNASSPDVLCRISHVGPAHMTVVAMPAIELAASNEEFHRNSGLLDGGLIVLSLFVLVTALINREKTYLLFSAWLIVNLRMGALSAGWDYHWLGFVVPPDWLSRSRLVTTALYYVLTFALFSALFRESLARAGFRPLLRLAQWSCLPLLALSAVLSYRHYLPILWVATGIGIAILVFFLARILIQTRSTVAAWYSLSISVTLLASLYEVISASFGLRELLGTLNSVTAALASSLLASLAIAEQMRQEHLQRLAAQAELQHTYDVMPIGLFTLDLQGRFTSANRALHQMLRETGPVAMGDAWARHFRNGSWARLHHLVYTQQEAELEVQGSSEDPEQTRRFLVLATLSRDRIEGTLQDITDKHKATEHLNFLAHHDPLTNVLNRNGIELAYFQALAGVTPQHPLALAYLDLDRFKLINDLYGHGTGDEILRQMCQRLQRVVTGDTRIGRVGGDEFVIVIPDTSMSLAAVICQSLIASIASEPYRRGDKSFQVRGSIGLIEIKSGTDFKEAISTADRACRAAKAGAKGLVVYDSNSTAYQEHRAEIQLVERLSANPSLDGLFLEMQPIMALNRPHDSLNFEVLLRMHDEHGNRVPVGSLISAGEHSGQMSDIDRWVLSTLLVWLDANREHLQTTKFVCVNLSGASLNDETFLDEVFEMLERYRHVASYLCVEVTESVALTDLGNTRRFIDRVRSCGARVALDDFGAGYTSFSYLKELPADLLKIDGSFIVNMNQHPANVSIVEAIVNLARNLGMKTIAEWAEDMATVQTLAELGVDYVQGFVVARPQAPQALLTAHSSASFIQDRELADFVLRLGQSDELLAQADLFGQDNPRKVH